MNDRFEAFRRTLIDYCLIAVSVFGPVALLPSLIYSFRSGEMFVFWLDLSVYLLILAATILRSLPDGVRAGILVGSLYILSVGLLAELGPWGSGVIWLYSVVAFSSLLLGRRTTIVVFAIESVTIAVASYLLYRGALDWNILWMEWLVHMVNFLVVSASLIVATEYLLHRLRTDNRQLGIEVEKVHRLHRELNHRVLNNLQLLESFVSLERDLPPNPCCLQSRIHCLAIAHEVSQSIDNDGAVDGVVLVAAIRDFIFAESPELRDSITIRRSDAAPLNLPTVGCFALLIHEVFTTCRQGCDAETAPLCSIIFDSVDGNVTIELSGDDRPISDITMGLVHQLGGRVDSSGTNGARTEIITLPRQVVRG